MRDLCHAATVDCRRSHVAPRWMSPVTLVPHRSSPVILDPRPAASR
ncbi:MAG: hypothetical protein MZV64_28525 [Ignavibacteriales bacterium]|nr:hypothetical protein [Ignavibacteriales bacterium]